MVVADTETGAPAASESAALGLRATGTEPGPVADHLHGDVADVEARRADPGRGLGEQGGTGGAGPRRVGGAELGAEVAQAGCREQRVARRVRRDVAVGVTLQAVVLVRPGQTGQVHRDAGSQAVDVDADADARHRGDRPQSHRRSVTVA